MQWTDQGEMGAGGRRRRNNQGKGRRKRGGEETEAETRRGRETENMLDRGGGGSCIQTDMERWDCVQRDQEDSQWARDAKKQDIFQEHVHRVGWKTHKKQQESSWTGN